MLTEALKHLMNAPIHFVRHLGQSLDSLGRDHYGGHEPSNYVQQVTA